jgi:hypothetical protein
MNIEQFLDKLLAKIGDYPSKYEFLILITGYWKGVFSHYWTFYVSAKTQLFL